MATLDDVREAMKARKSYISANLECAASQFAKPAPCTSHHTCLTVLMAACCCRTLTAKQTRKLLAKDLGVESSELDHFKSDIKQMLEEVQHWLQRTHQSSTPAQLRCMHSPVCIQEA